MNAKLNSLPELNVQKGFNKHDLSHYFGYKCSTGHIVPLFCDLLNPNERVQLNCNTFVRMQPLVRPAMCDIDVDIHYFFVPLDMLDIAFGRKWSRTRELFSSAVTAFGAAASEQLFRTNFVPDIPFNYRPAESNENIPNRPYPEDFALSAFRLMDYFGYNPFSVLKGAQTRNPKSSSDPFILDNGTTIQGPKNFNDYGSTFSPYVFPYALLAYNAVWEYWYRLEDRTQFNNKFFNIDRFYQSATFSPSIANMFSNRDEAAYFLGIKYAAFQKDYFTSSFRAPVINGLNLLGDNVSIRNFISQLGQNNFISDNETLFNAVNRGMDVDADFDPLTTVGIGDYHSGEFGESVQPFNLQDLRVAQAREKYMNILGRLPRKNYDNLVYSLFGATPPHDVKHELSHLGHEHFSINVGQIMSTASTELATLGELGGTGAGSSKSRGIKFTAPVHGVLIALQSIVPRVMYNGEFLRQNYVQNMQDFYNPVFDNLGMQPIFGFEVTRTMGSQIIGWQFRFEQWKRRFDRLSYAFSTGNERSWFVQRNSDGLSYIAPSSDAGSGSQDSNVLNNVNSDFFYCSPDVLNDVMVLQYESKWTENWLVQSQYNDGMRQKDLENWYLNPYQIYARDPFVCLSRIDCSKFSKMSEYGLVRFD